jgi:cysteine desulfuration protein SufE
MTELAEIVDTLELLGDWEARYQYLMELGEKLPPMPQALKTDANRVKPCMSTVHVAALPVPGQADSIRFVGDCDTAIIKGVLAVLISLCNERSSAQIQAIDMDEIFRQLQLDEHLSPNRHVGVYAIFELMKKQAGALAATDDSDSLQATVSA